MAGLKDKLNQEFRQAMKDHDELRRSVLRMVLAAVKNAEIDKRRELDDGEILGVLQKEVKQHNDSITAFEDGKRQDLADKEKAELKILEEYLPKQLSRDEIVAEARAIIEAEGAKGPGDKGKVMPKIIAKLKGKADGKIINEVVTELLNA
ncbi:MAG: GatB/YqeY domain-containing protein [Dehalococcoidales bacterium]|jgi:uncharacterized protein YqeY|nr:GatB/YqeY domain-containing protein [Dehalococcoidales bacterium]